MHSTLFVIKDGKVVTAEGKLPESADALVAHAVINTGLPQAVGGIHVYKRFSEAGRDYCIKTPLSYKNDVMEELKLSPRPKEISADFKKLDLSGGHDYEKLIEKITSFFFDKIAFVYATYLTLESVAAGLFESGLAGREEFVDFFADYVELSDHILKYVETAFDAIDERNTATINEIVANLRSPVENKRDSNELKSAVRKDFPDSGEKEALIEKIDKNDKLRFFKHQTLNVVAPVNPSTLLKMAKKELSKGRCIKDHRWYHSRIHSKKLQTERFISDIRKLLMTRGAYTRTVAALEVRELVDYIRLFNERATRFRYNGEYFSIDYKVNHDERIYGKKLHGVDKYEIEEAIDAILVNACEELALKQSSSDNPVTKNVRVDVVSDHERLHIDICDNGRGIPDAIRDKIFMPYFSYDSGTKSAKANGNGIGLYAGKKLIDQNGGRMSVDSCVEGTCFSLLFK